MTFAFTFQYGYSKTIEPKSNDELRKKFTFQYGYSKTGRFISLCHKHHYLHSSMVIVKPLITS